MRSGSTEFAIDLAKRMQFRYVGEPFNFPPSHISRSFARKHPTQYLADLVKQYKAAGLVMKIFAGHIHGRLDQLPPHCAVILERTNIRNRWCSLLRARHSGDWTGHIRYNCTAEVPPTYFTYQHEHWYSRVRQSLVPHIYITFEDVVHRRNHTLHRVFQFCIKYNLYPLHRSAHAIQRFI